MHSAGWASPCCSWLPRVSLVSLSHRNCLRDSKSAVSVEYRGGGGSLSGPLPLNPRLKVSLRRILENNQDKTITMHSLKAMGRHQCLDKTLNLCGCHYTFHTWYLTSPSKYKRGTVPPPNTFAGAGHPPSGQRRRPIPSPFFLPKTDGAPRTGWQASPN